MYKEQKISVFDRDTYNREKESIDENALVFLEREEKLITPNKEYQFVPERYDIKAMYKMSYESQNDISSLQRVLNGFNSYNSVQNALDQKVGSDALNNYYTKEEVDKMANAIVISLDQRDSQVLSPEDTNKLFPTEYVDESSLVHRIIIKNQDVYIKPIVQYNRYNRAYTFIVFDAQGWCNRWIVQSNSQVNYSSTRVATMDDIYNLPSWYDLNQKADNFTVGTGLTMSESRELSVDTSVIGSGGNSSDPEIQEMSLYTSRTGSTLIDFLRLTEGVNVYTPDIVSNAGGTFNVVLKGQNNTYAIGVYSKVNPKEFTFIVPGEAVAGQFAYKTKIVKMAFLINDGRDCYVIKNVWEIGDSVYELNSQIVSAINRFLSGSTVNNSEIDMGIGELVVGAVKEDRKIIFKTSSPSEGTTTYNCIQTVISGSEYVLLYFFNIKTGKPFCVKVTYDSYVSVTNT